MESNIIKNDIIIRKAKLLNILKNNNNKYFFNLCNEIVKDCNYLFIQVNFLLKSFVLYECSNNYNDYSEFLLNDNTIRFCFSLLRSENKIFSFNTDDIKTKIYNYFNNFFIKDTNFTFINTKSISHITNALSIDIQTNIVNNVVINFTKYIKQYIKIKYLVFIDEFIKLNKNFKDDNKTKNINSIYYDIINGTYNSDLMFSDFIKNIKSVILPTFNKPNNFKTIKESLNFNKKATSKIINNYIDTNLKIFIDTLLIDKTNKKNYNKIQTNIFNDIVNDTLLSDVIFHNWITDNKILLLNFINSQLLINLETELNNNPYKFIKYMYFMNNEIEKSNSKKNYQIIPQRSNVSFNHIPINTNALIDIIDSNFLENDKNYYHNNKEYGFKIWDLFIDLNNNKLFNNLKNKYVFSGTIMTDGYEIIVQFHSIDYDKKNKLYYNKGNESKKYIKEKTKNMTDTEKIIFENEYNKDKKEKQLLITKQNNEKLKQYKKNNEEQYIKKINSVKDELNILNNEYEKELVNLLEKYKNIQNEEYKTHLAILTHNYKRNYDNIINEKDNNLKNDFSLSVEI